MTGIEAAQAVTQQHQCHLVRPRKGAPGLYDAKPFGAGSKRGWFYLDAFSASAIVAVWNALNEANRAKFAALSIPKMARVAFKLVR